MQSTKDYKEQVLEELAHRFDINHNSLADAYALIWAIDVYASLASFENGKIDDESTFKRKIEQECEAFKIIRSASNAIKHIERSSDAVEVKSMGDIHAGSGRSMHAWYSNHGNSEPSVAITMNWEYDPDTKAYKDGTGKLREAPEVRWKSQYLKKLYRPAIEAIEAKIVALQ